MTPKARLLLALAALALGLLIAALLIEALAAYRWHRTLDNNPYYRAKVENGYLPQHDIRPLQPYTGTPDPAFRPQLEAQHQTAPPSPCTPANYNETTEERRQRYQHFLTLDEEHRACAATTHLETVLLLDADANLRKRYGQIPMLMLHYFHAYTMDDPRDALTRTARRTLQQTFHHRNTAPFLECPLEPDLEATLLPLDSQSECPGGALLFIRPRKNPVFFPPSDEALPPDTPWAVPFYRYKPNLRNHRGSFGKPINTNSLGFRNPEIARPKPPGTYRILCIGGSTTEEGQTDDTTYPAVLQRLLREYTRNDRIEVVNCGIVGAGTIHEVIAAADYLALEPDLVLFYEGVNEINGYIAAYGYMAASTLQRWARLSTFAKRTFPRALYPPDTTLDRYLDQYTFAQLGTVVSMLRARGAVIVFASADCPWSPCFTPDERDYFDWAVLGINPTCTTFTAWEHFLDRFNARLRQWCAEKGLAYLPLAENLAQGIEAYYDHCHLYDNAIALKTRILFEYLKDYVARQAAR